MSSVIDKRYMNLAHHYFIRGEIYVSQGMTAF